MPSQNSGPLGAAPKIRKPRAPQRAALAETLNDRADACALHDHRANADHRQRQADGRRIPAVAIGRIEHEG